MKHSQRIQALSFLIFCVLSTIRADDELLFRHITRNDGLLHDNVTCTTQDSLGYIWFGTHRGLNRYDGYSIDSYKYENGKLNSVYYNRVYSIQIVGDYLWAATEAGLACFDVKAKRFVDFEISDKSNESFYSRVRTVKRGIDNQLWLLSNNRIVLVKIETDNPKDNLPKLKAIKIGDSYEFVSNESNPKVTISNNGDVWLTGTGYLSAYRRAENGELVSWGTIDDEVGRGVRDIYCDNEYLWIAYENRLVKYLIEDKTTCKLGKQFETNTQNGVNSLYVDSKYVWVGSNEGLLQISRNTDSIHIVEHKHSPLNPYSVGNDMNNIFLDRDNNLWVSTWGAGISYANTAPRLFQAIRYSPVPSGKTMGSEFISSMHYSKDGYVYIGTKFGGLSRFDVNTKEVIQDFCNSPELLPSITSIQSDANYIYTAVKDMIIVISKRDRSIVSIFKTLNGGYIFWLDFDKFKRLWATTYAGLECFEKKNGEWESIMQFTSSTPEPCRLSTNMLHNICSDTLKNELVITSVMGINRVILNEEGKAKLIVKYLAKENDENSLSSNFVWPISKGNGESTYWVGTMGSGLNKLTMRDHPDGTYDYVADSYGVESGATSNDIESVEVDKYGNIWCGGLYLSCFDDELKRFNVFDTNDGLQSYMFGTSSSCRDREGNLYFGGANGFNYFTPVPQASDTTSYHVYFTRFHNNGKVIDSDIEYSHSLQLKYPDNNFSVNFTSLSYNLQHHIRYRYKLEGYDNDWRYIETGKEPTVSYRKIPYGSHKLLVEVGDWKNWESTQYVLKVYSQPPFWLTWWAYAFYLLFLSGMLYVGFKYFIRWMQMKNTIAMQQEQERQKEEMIQMKMRFFTDVSHEFKTPLTLINSAISEIDEEEELVRGNKYFNIIKRNSGKLLNLVNELLDFHRSDIKSAKLRTTYISIPDYVKDIYEEFKGWAELSHIRLNLHLPADSIEMWADQEHLGKILSNILSNSMRYSKAGGEVNVVVSKGKAESIIPKYKTSFRNMLKMETGEQLLIAVNDTGVGISENLLPKIFERFHQAESKTSRHLGSGIGLSLVKSLVELHHGGIIISSERNTGTEIIIALPLSGDYLSDEEKVDESSFELKEYLSDYAVEYEPLDIEESVVMHSEGKPTILLVDDNHEILMVLREYFKKEYNVVMAIDGQEALDKCKTYFPEIVISDVMMPRMNGIELCTNLKKHLRTCFIPVILLTAKSTIEHQIEGIETGADAYISKPFNLKLLKATVRNLLNKSLQVKNSMPVDNIRQEILNKKQGELFDKLNLLVNTNLTNSDFSVDHLCLELGLNRTKLYNTIKSATGMSLGNYIRKIRLDKAAELLKTTDMSISEIGYAIGIESPSYFTRSFKEQFGVSPSEYLKH